MWTADNLSLKSSMLVADTIVWGRQFHRGIISGKKEYCNNFVCAIWMYFMSCPLLVYFDGLSCSDGIITSLWVIRYPIMISALSLLCFQVSHDSSSSISVTLSHWPYLAITDLAVLLWIISVLYMYLSSAWWGLHTVDVYSSVGCTSVLYAFSLVVHAATLIFSNPRALFPLLTAYPIEIFGDHHTLVQGLFCFRGTAYNIPYKTYHIP